MDSKDNVLEDTGTALKRPGYSGKDGIVSLY